MTQEQFNQMMDKYIADRNNQPAPDWAVEELNQAVAAGITDGMRPQAFMTRAEGAIMALRAVKAAKEE